MRVRLLLDDLNTGGLDPTIAALDAHPNIEVRLYNPLVQRGARMLNFLTDFGRVNRRMHNKSFTVDNQVSVVGGRNIANEYFGAGSGVVYADLDVIAVGAAVREVSKEFDLYWNSPSAYPAASFVGAPGPDGAADLEARFAATRADPESVAFIEAARTTSVVRDLLGGQLALEWTHAQVVYDDPAKTLDTTDRTDVLLFPELVRTIGRPEKTLDLISPYFVPGEEGTAALVTQAGKGVKVRIFTNSLASSEASVVHAGYAKRREDLLRAGVRLYEIKSTAAREARDDKIKFGSSSSAALHAKTFAVDRSRIFVGSFNFDQRSARLNTEMGLVIDSPTFARQLAERFDTPRPWVRTRSGSGRTVAVWNGSSGPLRAKRVTTPSRERPGSSAGASTSTRSFRSTGCSSWCALGRLGSCMRLLLFLLTFMLVAAGHAASLSPDAKAEIDRFAIEARSLVVHVQSQRHLVPGYRGEIAPVAQAEVSRRPGHGAERRAVHRARRLEQQHHGSALPGQMRERRPGPERDVAAVPVAGDALFRTSKERAVGQSKPEGTDTSEVTLQKRERGAPPATRRA